MRVGIVSFSRRGAVLGERLRIGLKQEGWQADAFGKGRYMDGIDETDEILKTCITRIEEPVGQWTGKNFSAFDAFIFVGACGIAVRSIAPYIRHKTEDPAVVAMDERGRFAISLLSGHIGGGNDLTQTAAGIVGAQPVVTTATDLNQVFAVDVFAKKNNCHISDMKVAKEVSARLLAGEPVGFFSDLPGGLSWRGELPAGLEVSREGEDLDVRPELGISLTLRPKRVQPFSKTLYLIPRVITVGIGCRRGIASRAVADALCRAADQAGLSLSAVSQAASIDLKREEPGLVSYCREQKLPFVTFTAEELESVEGDFTSSSFVSSVTGVDNVCERSAVLASGGGRLLRKKTAQDGVTVAFAMEAWQPVF